MRYFITAFAVLFALISCGKDEKIDCGKTLTWKAEGESVALKAVAGEKCSNYSDYYDADLNQIIAKIQSMKIVLYRKCYEMTAVDSDPEEVEVACPDFVPETVEFSELTECSFGTPPQVSEDGSTAYCFTQELGLCFKSNNNFDRLCCHMFAENPGFKAGSSEVYQRAFEAVSDGVVMIGFFNDDALTSATIVFTWTEDEIEKTLEFSAIVEIKD